MLLNREFHPFIATPLQNKISLFHPSFQLWALWAHWPTAIMKMVLKFDED
jgi:hypothetical protein